LNRNKKKGNIIRIMKRVGLLLVALCLTVTVGFPRGGGKSSQEPPDAILRLSGGSFAAGIGFSWREGTLTYKDKTYPVSVNGMSIGKVGITNSTALCEVYHLRKLTDFDGHYTSAGAGLSLVGGVSVVTTMQNQNGVRINLHSTTRGAPTFTIGHAGVDMRIKM
jgi:hypothetical protein